MTHYPPCDNCPVQGTKAIAPPTGPVDAPFLFVGEAAGRVESIKKIPFVGPSGDELNRWIQRLGLRREDVRIGNCLLCHPVNDWLVGAPWETEGLARCRTQLDELLGEQHKVIVTLGGTATRQVLNLRRGRASKSAEGGVRVQDFHGSPCELPGTNRSIVVPTFHPAFILNGNQKFRKTVMFDLEVAQEVAEGTFKLDKPDLIIDPPPDWFEQWVNQFLAGFADEFWLSVDIETPDKAKTQDEGELSRKDSSYEILCINLSCDVGQGITVPWQEPYITVVRRLLLGARKQVYWNATYDVPRLRHKGIQIPWENVYDFMDAWHVLHSSLPRGLGFVAPFYSKAGPWKHLGNADGTYRAMDGVQTLRCAYGIETELKQVGMWKTFLRYCHDLDARVLRPAEEVGLLVPRADLEAFKAIVDAEAMAAETELQTLVPKELHPLSKPYVRLPEDGDVVEKGEDGEVLVCVSCGQEKVVKKHRCKGWLCCFCGGRQLKKPTKKAPAPCGHPPSDWARLSPVLKMKQLGIIRYYKRLPFNPGSRDHVMAYAKARKHRVGIQRKTKKETVDKKTLNRLLKTGDPVYPQILRYRRADKMSGTYGASLLAKLDGDSRLHGTFTHAPSTMRLASKDPNLQNLAHHVLFAEEFRRCIKAAPGAVLLSADFSAIEAVLTGYFCGDPLYIRLAKLGVHSYLTSVLVGEPVDLNLPDDELKRQLAVVKEKYPSAYNMAKRCVHGYNYGLTPFGMSEQFPDIFPKKKDAEKVVAVYESLCPQLAAWQRSVRMQAHNAGKLGGPNSHPFGFRHDFYGVLSYRRDGNSVKEYLGEDAKSCVAFFPQSTAGGVLYEACLRLLDPNSGSYIGDAFFGKTPVRALIHDELFCEVQDSELKRVQQRVTHVMTSSVSQLPMPREWGLGDYLRFDISMKVGRNWGEYDEVYNPDGMQPVGPVGPEVFHEEDEEDEEDEEAA